VKVQEIVRRLKGRGLQLAWDAEAGRPLVRGPGSMITPALLRVLALHRDQLARLVAPRVTRRVLELAAADPGAPAAAVLWEGSGGELQELARLARETPGRVLAAEQLRRRSWDGHEEWQRFAWRGV